MTKATPRPTMSPLAKFAMGFQAFMLRRNWMGAMGDFVMVITVTGRKSGKKYSTPIGYIREGDTVIGLTRKGEEANWYKNALAGGEILLEIKGQAFRAHATAVQTLVEREQVQALYQKVVAPQTFQRLFGVLPTASPAELAQGFATREFIKFQLIK